VLKSLLFNSRYLENILTMVYFEGKENIVYFIHLNLMSYDFSISFKTKVSGLIDAYSQVFV
jgi:hypothetical protein